ncbi:DNA helicase [Malassezia obtusa]|uniref:ATP-dependent DNA helicase n=1 Tax=Malassezia obtusa TaxID=76774 RepID=A0AAF0E311_9BASI|nr:DNA helicase [Malassezia obtusa]
MADVDAEFDDALDDSVLAHLDDIEAAHAHPDRDLDLDPATERLLIDAFDALDDEVAAERAPLAERPQAPAAPARASTAAPAKRHAESRSPRVPPPHTAPKPAAPAAPAAPSTPASSGLTQQGLWGHTYTPSSVESSQGSLSLAPVPPSASTGGFAWTASKVWDHSVFLQGNRVSKAADDERPAPRMAHAHTPPPMKLALDADAARTWIYPVNKPLRTYQLNIVQKALFHNVLVALPTGLGKTFIAAVVILNLYRWFPAGKSTCAAHAVIFVAPTRPLVTQQQQACHSICGLPWDTAIELTGSTRRALRDDEWHAKRIFYMTPQTFENDLLSTTCDARDVVCVVVDEAHRATGNYAYCKVIRHLMYHNPHFRVLALTATPGSHADKVQEVVDNLHINRIEIRTEDALDIQPYLHTKHEQLVRVPLGARVEALRAAWVALMRTFHEPLLQHGVLRHADTGALRAFAVRAACSDAHGRAVLAERPYLRGSVTQLANMAHALQYLAEESVRVFCDRAQAIVAPSKTGARKNAVFSPRNPAFQAYVLALEDVQADLVHPKMHALRDVLAEHVARHADTRVMVFCSYREVVTELVALLQDAGLAATPFIGQATDKKGNRGFTQKVQEQILADFQRGTFQVLVATSIGEEGLDIGEVDLIVCYEAVRDSVRALQRVGRTGRMRDGCIVVLMTEGREEHNWQHSKDSYRHVQRLVRAANVIELYTDVSRLLPDSLRPEPHMCEVEQPPFDARAVQRTPAPRGRPPKPKPTPRRARKPASQLPLAFCSASELRRTRHDEHREGADDAPHAPSTSRPSALANLSDDSDDAEIASGLRHSSSSAYTWPPSSREAPREAPRASPRLDTPPPRSSACSASGASGASSTSSASSAPLAARSPPDAARSAAEAARRAAPAPAPPAAQRTLGARRRVPRAASPGEAPSPCAARFAPHPLVAELAGQTPEDAGGDGPGDAQDGAERAADAPDAPDAPDALDTPEPLFLLSQESASDAPIASGARSSSLRVPTSPAAASSAPRHPRAPASSPDTPPRPRRKRRRGAPAWLHDEAERETDSEVHGETDEDDSGPGSSDENDSDRAAVGDFPATQHAGYSQEAIYLQSLLSQRAPTPFRGRDRLQELLARRRAARPSSEPPVSDDAYSHDSFVVGDDEVSWAESSDA